MKVASVARALQREKHSGVKIDVAVQAGLVESPQQARGRDLIGLPGVEVAGAPHPGVRRQPVAAGSASTAACKKSKMHVPLATVSTTVCAPAATPDAIRRRPAVGAADDWVEYALTAIAAPPSTETLIAPPTVESAVPQYRLCAELAGVLHCDRVAGMALCQAKPPTYQPAT